MEEYDIDESEVPSFGLPDIEESPESEDYLFSKRCAEVCLAEILRRWTRRVGKSFDRHN